MVLETGAAAVGVLAKISWFHVLRGTGVAVWHTPRGQWENAQFVLKGRKSTAMAQPSYLTETRYGIYRN